MRIPRIAWVLFLLSLVPFARAAEEDARLVVAPPGLASGDYDRVARELVGVVERNPASDLALLALDRLRAVLTWVTDGREVTDRLLQVLGKGGGDFDESLRWFLRARLRARGEFERAAKLAAGRGYVREWLVAGPFGFDSPALLDRPYGPEREISLTKVYEEGPPQRRFRKLPMDPTDISVDPFDLLRPASGVAYALAQVHSRSARSVILEIRCSGSLAAIWNGARILRLDRLRERRPGRVAVKVEMREGWNRLLLKLPGRRGASVKIVDAGRRFPLPDLSFEKGLALHEIAEGGSARAEAVPPALPAGTDAWSHSLRALALARQGFPLRALREAEAAAESAPDQAAIRFLLGTLYEAASELPEVWRKNRAKAAYRKVLDTNADYAPALVRLALLRHADDKSEEAAESLKALLEKHPGNLEAWNAISRVARDRGWEKEALDAARKCLELHAGFRPAAEFLVSHYERYGFRAAATALTKKEIEANATDYGAMVRLADHESDAGDLDGAIGLLRKVCGLYPGSVNCRRRLAALLARVGRKKEAGAIYRELAELRPLSPSWPRRIGDLLRDEDPPAAVKAYRESLVLDPGQLSLRRYVARIEGEPDDFSKPWEREVLDLIPGSPGRKEYPKAPAVCLLDLMVTRIEEDGSSSDVIHQAYKILDEKGVEAFGRMNTSGETLEVRAIAKDGRIFEPIAATGSSYNMPALEPGAVVEVRYRTETRRDPRTFDTGAFYFADPDFDNAVLLSRWVIIMPRGFSATFLTRNFHGEHEVTTEGDRVVHVFTAERSARTEREPFMPSAEKLLPWVRIHRNLPFADLNAAYAARLWRGLAPTPWIREEAEKVLEGIEGTTARARSLYDHVNELVTGGTSFGGPTATLLEKAGDRFDLLASLLIAAGIPFEPAMACPNRGLDVNWEIVSPSLFTRRCLRIATGDGPPIWVFAGSRYDPFGRIPDTCRDSPVYVTGLSSGRIETLPADDAHPRGTVTTARILLGDAESPPVVEIRSENRTDSGYGMKESLKEYDADERKQRISRWVARLFTGPVLESFDYPGVTERGTPAVMTARAEIPNYVRPEGDHVKIGLGLFRLNLEGRYVGKPERIHPMILRAHTDLADRVEIDLGDHYRVLSLPEGHTALGPLGSYSLIIERKGDRILVRRAVRFHRARLTPDEYRDFIPWVKAIDEAESRKILLATE